MTKALAKIYLNGISNYDTYSPMDFSSSPMSTSIILLSMASGAQGEEKKFCWINDFAFDSPGGINAWNAWWVTHSHRHIRINKILYCPLRERESQWLTTRRHGQTFNIYIDNQNAIMLSKSVAWNNHFKAFKHRMITHNSQTHDDDKKVKSWFLFSYLTSHLFSIYAATFFLFSLWYRW